MPTYRYTAKDENGKQSTGFATAENEQALYQKLRTDGKFLLSCKVSKKGDLQARRLSVVQNADFCRQLGTLLHAGVPLARALAILAEEDGLDPFVKRVYNSLQQDIRKGVSLSDAMTNCAPAFPELLIGMIRSAEGTGSIDRSALRMAVHYEKEHRLNQQVANTMMYPLILAVLIVVVVVFLLIYVVPQFQPLFDEMESLPWPTTLLLGFSNLVKNHWILLLLGLAVLFIIFRMLLRLSSVRLFLDRQKLHLPVIGKLQRKICTARFARTLADLYSSGVPIVSSLASCRDTVNNTYLASQFDGVLTMVRSGESLSESIGTMDGLERKVVSSIKVGEETGQLDEMLNVISDNMDFEAESATKRMMTLLEPVMIILMALIVCFVVVAVILPIYQSYSTIGAGSY